MDAKVSNLQKLLEEQIKLLKEDIKLLSDANNALTKRLDDVETKLKKQDEPKTANKGLATARQMMLTQADTGGKSLGR